MSMTGPQQPTAEQLKQFDELYRLPQKERMQQVVRLPAATRKLFIPYVESRKAEIDAKLSVKREELAEATRRVDDATRQADEATRRLDEAARRVEKITKVQEEATKRCIEAERKAEAATRARIEATRQRIEAERQEQETKARLESQKAEAAKLEKKIAFQKTEIKATAAEINDYNRQETAILHSFSRTAISDLAQVQRTTATPSSTVRDSTVRRVMK